MRRPLASLAVAAAALLCAGPAWALPGDPPVTPIAPADGASLPTASAGIPVSYACPLYRTSDFGDGIVRTGDESYYTVLLSRSPTLDGEGRLATPDARGTGSSTPADPNTCNLLLRADVTPAPQVSRICAGCSPQFETGPVRSFTLVSSEKPTLSVPARTYAGFAFIATVGVKGAPAGTAVTVQRRSGSRWVAAGRGTTSGDSAAVTTTLPAGAVTVRAQLAIGGQTLTSAERRLRVRRPADAPRTAVRAGAWSGASGVGFRVAGRTITGFAAQVPLLCPTPGLVGQFTTQIARAAVARNRHAPDGASSARPPAPARRSACAAVCAAPA